MKSISLIVLTRDKTALLERCLGSAKGIISQVIVVIDSRSAGGTAEVAKKFGADVFTHPFKNQADQFNWALDNLEIKGDWILKLDDDEYLTPELAEEIKNSESTDEINGYYAKRRVYFMSRWIKHGDYYPRWFLRLWRKGKGRSEDKEMDEHIILTEGKTGYLKNDFIDDNKKGLKELIEDHKNYATREANDVLKGNAVNNPKRSFYYRLPIFIRPCLYFFYRYFLRLGFLDGLSGLLFHSIQGFWYRFLVDVRIFKAKYKNNGKFQT